MAGGGHGHGGGGGGGGGGGAQGSGQLSQLWNGMAAIAGVWLVLTGVYWMDAHDGVFKAVFIIAVGLCFLVLPYGVHRVLWTAPIIDEWLWTRRAVRFTALLCAAVALIYVLWTVTVQLWAGSSRSHLTDHVATAAVLTAGLCLLMHAISVNTVERFLAWCGFGWHSIGIGHAPHPEGDKHDKKHDAAGGHDHDHAHA